MTQKLIKRFDFNPEESSRVDVSGGLRLNWRRRRLELPRVPATAGASVSAVASYSTDQDLTARTWVTNPQTLRGWLGFEVERRKDPAHSDPNVDGTPVTIRFRLTDGTDDLWWDGAAWSVAGVGEWNTDAEIATNIAQFSVAGRKLGVVINMFTTDANVTPSVSAIKILYEADINEEWDIVYNSLVPAIKENVKARGRVVYKLTAQSDEISFADLSALGFDTAYNIADVVSTFDYTNDPTRTTDLTLSFDANTKLLTLSSELPADTLVYVDFLYTPTVAVHTTRDWREVSSVPAIDITNLIYSDVLPAGASLGSQDSVHHPTTGQGWRVPGAREFQVDMVIEVIGDKQYDVSGLAKSLKRWVSSNPILTMAGTDEGFQMLSEGQQPDDSFPNEDDIRVHKLPLSILRVTAHDLDAVASARPSKIVFTGGNLTLTAQ